jgi:hypothetical protein
MFSQHTLYKDCLALSPQFPLPINFATENADHDACKIDHLEEQLAKCDGTFNTSPAGAGWSESRTKSCSVEKAIGIQRSESFTACSFITICFCLCKEISFVEGAFKRPGPSSSVCEKKAGGFLVLLEADMGLQAEFMHLDQQECNVSTLRGTEILLFKLYQATQ